MRLRALTDMSLRQSPDRKSPLFEEWHNWKKGEEFDPPEHMNVAKALSRGIVEPAVKKAVKIGKA